ncbi:MAG: ATP-binding protein [Lachnospiraceae bacterium]|nr:ATP-binding protein [Lachnospiraceae bacterium]
MKELVLQASADRLEEVQEFVRGELEAAGCSLKVMSQVEIAVEEIYVNIVHYAYPSGGGEAVIRCEAGSEPPKIAIQFLDAGTPFDPLEKEDADISLSAEERSIGGLGILMVKKLMDEVTYSYEDGKNVLTIVKYLQG